MPQTLEQMRAADAWHKCQGCSKDYQNLAKSLPALIMNSGLLQVLAFLHEKGAPIKNSAEPKQLHCAQMEKDLRAWLRGRFPQLIRDESFAGCMTALMAAPPRDFQAVTTESLAWLRWARQLAPAARQEA